MQPTILIGGRWSSEASGGHLTVRDPATDDVLAEVPQAGPVEIGAAIDAAATALPGWAATPAVERAAVLVRLARRCREQATALATTISQESGKPLGQAAAEVEYAVGFLEVAAGEGPRATGEMLPSSRPGQRMLVTQQPIGVTAAITPWNFPLAMITRKLGPALAVGCTQVIKPAEQTPLTAAALCELAVDAGVPAGVVGLVTTPGQCFADVVFADPRVRKVSFTGSTEVGRQLIARSAAHITKLSLELGGGSPFVVLDDADLDDAVAQGLKAKFRNSGQSCTAANRFFVARSQYEDFCDAFADAAGQLRVGPWHEDPDVGPLIDDAAVAKVRRHVDDAVARGGKVRTGGQMVDLGHGFADRFVAPTLVSGLTDDMAMATEETFGPVAGARPFDDVDEAVALCNASPSGLAAYVCGTDVGQLLGVADRLEFGVVGLNDGLPANPRAPFGGMKESGIGREGGRQVMGEYLETQYVSLMV